VCSFAFRVAFPRASSYYTFEVGHQGEVYQESYDDSALRLRRYHLTFTIP
jgi:hypothetical protein